MADIVQLVENGTKKYLKTHAKAVDGLLDMFYPIGSIFQSVKDEDPSTIMGGNWKRYAQGQTIVGVNEDDPDFDTAGKTGGVKAVTLTTDQIPSHNHDTGMFRGSNPPGTGGTGGYTWGDRGAVSGNKMTIATGGGQSHNNMQPYITVYTWVRTA